MDSKIILRNTFHIENASSDGENLTINGYCAHYNIPNLNNEIVDEKSFDYFFSLYNDKKIKPALNFNHTDTIIGGVDIIESKEDGLWMEAHLNGNVAICRDMIIPCILNNDLDSFSTEGYIYGNADGVVFNDDDTYYVKDFLLTAVAIVPTPADANAKFTIRNYLNNLPKQEPQYVTPSIILL